MTQVMKTETTTDILWVGPNFGPWLDIESRIGPESGPSFFERIANLLIILSLRFGMRIA